MFNIKGLAVLGVIAGAWASAHAQRGGSDGDLPKEEIAVDYSYTRANATPSQCGCFNMNGGSAEGAVHAYRGLSAVFDLTGEHTGTTSVAGQSLSLLSFTGGPRFSHPISSHGHTRYAPFVQGLVGAVHGFNAPFPNSSGSISTSATALAVLVGGGLDISLNHKLAIRLIQADYGLTHLPNNANDSQNLLRLSTGVVFRLP